MPSVFSIFSPKAKGNNNKAQNGDEVVDGNDIAPEPTLTTSLSADTTSPSASPTGSGGSNDDVFGTPDQNNEDGDVDEDEAPAGKFQIRM